MRTMTPQELTPEQSAIVADRARVWETRRFCQVLPSIVKYERGQNVPRESRSGNEADGALAALLRCIIYQLDADLAMVSLLDDHTQYFLSGASRPLSEDAKVTMESTQWYGCESVTHHGGLCERTITQQNCKGGSMAFYEELDLAGSERTRCLPFVDGSIARFRYYAGVPLNPYDGPNVGTVFLFKEQPCEARSPAAIAIRSYLTEIAVHIRKHLEQAVEALEGRRVMRFNRGIEALVKTGTTAATNMDPETLLPDNNNPGQQPLISNQYTDVALRTYRSGASLLQDIFDFDGVRIQERGAAEDFVNSNPGFNGSKIMAHCVRPDVPEPGEISGALVSALLECFPLGAVFQIESASGAVIAATSANSVPVSIGDPLATALSSAFPQAQQVILMPLWDPHFERNIGIVLGYACDQSRVYLSSNDLSSMSAFCTTLMTQVRRLEVQATDKVKSDFLGSVSHELRTPLHGVLSSLELLADVSSNEVQQELIQMARYSGMSLLDVINRILRFSKISSKAQLGDDKYARIPTNQLSDQPSRRNLHSSSTSTETAGPSIIDVCEKTIQGAARRLHLKKKVRPELCSPRHSSVGVDTPSVELTDPMEFAHPLTILFDTNATHSCRLNAGEDFETVLLNLLDNAIKFGDQGGCVRIRLDVDEAAVKLSVSDTGKGIAPNFIRHAIFDPFSQADPSSEGTGLGLSLVKKTVTALGGSMLIDSDEEWGSDFTALLCLNRVASDSTQTSSNSIAVPLPALEMRLYPSRRWTMEDDARGQRCVQMLNESLARGLSRWFTIDRKESNTPGKAPRLLFVLLGDLSDAKQTHDDLVNYKTIVLCPDSAEPRLHPIAPTEDLTTIVGPVTVTALRDAMIQLFPSAFKNEQEEGFSGKMSRAIADLESSNGHPEEGDSPSGTANRSSLPQLLSDLDLDRGRRQEDRIHTNASYTEIATVQGLPAPAVKGELETYLKVRASNLNGTAQSMATRASSPSPLSDRVTIQPKIMLVDDNAINLKVVGMFARKCSTIPPVSVGGGQAAIDAFKDSLASEGSVGQPYDIMFLDLSMPDVSGFDVAEEIRRIEARSKVATRTHICALTALTSTQDHNRAYESGVDDFLVKPARFHDLQAVVKKWRKKTVQ